MQDLLSNIKHCEQQYHRPSGSVVLLAASKGRSVESISKLYQQGQKIFGENYLQEALDKISALPKDITWHFIGPMQRNKTRKIAEHFAWVQSVDNEIIAKRLSDQRPESMPPLNICIEVNIDNEATKSGALINDVLMLARYCRALPRIQLRGLMAIPSPQPTLDQQRHAFHQLQQIYQSLIAEGIPLDTLSMGMSHDYEAAIAEGSTMIRIGRALFQ